MMKALICSPDPKRVLFGDNVIRRMLDYKEEKWRTGEGIDWLRKCRRAKAASKKKNIKIRVIQKKAKQEAEK